MYLHVYYSYYQIYRLPTVVDEERTIPIETEKTFNKVQHSSMIKNTHTQNNSEN